MGKGKGDYLSLTYEKIALFSLDNETCSHLARQLNSREWTSKLGVSYDVKHTLTAIEDGLYGNAVLFMKRKISS